MMWPIALITAVPPPEVVLEAFVTDEKARAALVAHLDRAVARSARQIAKHSTDEIEAALREQIATNLIDKLARGLLLDPPVIEKTVIDYELFKAEKFVSAGVFPKRYFGYLDEKWDTADLERRMRRTIRAGVEESNAHLARTGSRTRITDMEVAVTFLAEGGALLLSAPGAFDLRRIHPVLGVGLDDIAIGFERHPELIARLDERLGIDLAAIVDRSDADPVLARYMTFEEAIAGTIVMWIYEKELAARKLTNAEKKKLEELPADEQFIFASLVYNSGLIFSTARMKMIRDFETAAYLDQVSRENEKRRWRLPLFGTERNLELLLEERRYPDQPTSWSAVYHVLQRYGAYVALGRFTSVFDGRGRFHERTD